MKTVNLGTEERGAGWEGGSNSLCLGPKGLREGTAGWFGGFCLGTQAYVCDHGHNNFSRPESAVGHWPPSKCVAGNLPDQPPAILLAEPDLLGRTEADIPGESLVGSSWLSAEGDMR